MAKSAGERGPFGAWLVEQRKRLSRERKRTLTAEQVRQEIAATGYGIDPAHYRALEGGSKKPGRETREALALFFGTEPPNDNGKESSGIDALVAAVRDQTNRMDRLITLLEKGALTGIAEGRARFETELQGHEDDEAPDASQPPPSPGTPP